MFLLSLSHQEVLLQLLELLGETGGHLSMFDPFGSGRVFVFGSGRAFRLDLCLPRFATFFLSRLARGLRFWLGSGRVSSISPGLCLLTFVFTRPVVALLRFSARWPLFSFGSWLRCSCFLSLWILFGSIPSP